MADPIITSYGKEMKQRRGYLLEGTGGSMPNGHVKYITMMFVGLQKVDLSEARRLYVEAVEGLICKINENNYIRPFLDDYPATSKNTNIYLSFADKNLKPIIGKHVALIYLVNNKIYYRSYNKNEGLYERCYEEPYEEALRIVQSEKL
jgi:hypothetical protein